MFGFSNYWTKSKYYGNSNKVMVGKMKDETTAVVMKEFAGRKAKGINKNVVAAVSHNGYESVLLKKKCLRHLMNRIQSKYHRIGT